MDFKKMWKRFFTLDRHHAEGFTLVELIVVIAILAILGGVAVPAYSGYVTKANMGADQALVSEVAHALTLYYYSHPEITSGYVVLNKEGTDSTADNVGTAAMQAVFGDNWAETATLKYDGWVPAGTKVGNVTRVALEQALRLNEDGADTSIIGDSSFITGSTPEELMKNVTELTFVATGLFEGMNDYYKYSIIKKNLFGGDSQLLEDYCKDFGITTGKNENDDPVFGANVTNEQLSNLLVFGAAQQITADGTPSLVVDLVNKYAEFAGFVNSVKGTADEQAAQEAYAELNAALKGIRYEDDGNNSNRIAGAFDAFKNNEAIKNKLDAYLDDDNEVKNKDKAAFKLIMGAVDEASGIVTPEEMQSADFFASDKVSGFFNTYLTAAEAASNMTKDQIEAALATMGNGGIVVTMNGGDVSDSAGILQKGN